MSKLSRSEQVFNSQIRSILAEVANGGSAVEEAVERVRELIVQDLGYAKVDLHRAARKGRPEVIFCQGKKTGQVIEIARTMVEAGQSVLMTRTTEEMRDQVQAAFSGKRTRRNDDARVLFIEVAKPVLKGGIVGVVCAGTTDIPVAEEAAMTAEALGSRVERLFDVGVAGLHRLLRHRESLDDARVLVVVAGMEGALASVVGGLVKAPVIAVPTSVGYGAAFGGVGALLAMLNACAPGISVVNIDNGFGAGYLADVINEIGEPPS